MVLTADQHIDNVIKFQKKQNQEKSRHAKAVSREQVRRENYEYMRDELMSAVKNSGMSFEDIHGHCGPTKQTLEKYATRQTTFPQMRKMQSVADIIGLRWTLIPK